MYKNLNLKALGVSGRQSELIELALSYKFDSFDLDFNDQSKRAGAYGVEYSARFVDSACTRAESREEVFRTAGFELPIKFGGDEAAYRAEYAKLNEYCEVAKSVRAEVCYAIVSPGSEELAMPENFQRHQQRLREVADVLAEFGIKLAVGFSAAADKREGVTHQFVQTGKELVELVSGITSENAGLLLDTWDWHASGSTLADLEPIGAQRVYAVRIAGIAEDAENPPVEFDRVLPEVGGGYDPTEYLQWLSDGGFAGPVACCPHPKRVRGQSRDVISKRASEALVAFWVAIGLMEAPAAAAVSEEVVEGEASDSEGNDETSAVEEETATATEG